MESQEHEKSEYFPTAPRMFIHTHVDSNQPSLVYGGSVVYISRHGLFSLTGLNNVKHCLPLCIHI